MRWGGKSWPSGPYAETTVPSGATSATYSPSARSLKLVCNELLNSRRSLPEANTTRYSSAVSVTDGNSHLSRSVALSVSVQPSRSIGSVPSLWISIQSGVAPSSSSRAARSRP